MKIAIIVALGLWVLSLQPTDAAWPSSGNYPGISGPPPSACTNMTADLSLPTGCNLIFFQGTFF